MLYDVLIIGAGPAGMTAGIYAKRANLKVAIFEKYAPGGQIVNTAEIENYTGFKKTTGFELATSMLNHVDSLGVEIIYDEVLNVLDEGSIKKLVTPSATYEAKSVILATGTVPRRLGVENEDMLASKGISWCAICDGPMFKNKDVVVVGGGNSAVEEASYLATLTNKVTVIQNLADLTADKKAQDILKTKDNVEFKFSAQVTKFIPSETNTLQAVEIVNADGSVEQIQADGVFEYVGLIPVTTMVKDLGITDQYGYVFANEKMETAVKGIYSAGDLNVKQIRQVVTATSDGAIATQNVLKYLEEWQ